MRKTYLVLIALISFAFTVKAQIEYSFKIDFGYLKFSGFTVKVDPGPNWKGYYLKNRQNGLDFTCVNGITNSNKNLFLGIGLSYINFEGINGFSVFTDLDYRPLKRRISPLLNVNAGYNQIWNQYSGGTNTSLFELGAGLDYKISNNISISAMTGLMFLQQSLFTPIKMGLQWYNTRSSINGVKRNPIFL